MNAAIQPLNATQAAPKARRQTVLLSISNMHCSSCVNKIQTALKPYEQAVSMRAEPTTRTLSLSWESNRVSLNKLIQTISQAGFPAQLVNISDHQDAPNPTLQRIAVALLFTMQTMMLALAGYLGADQSDVLIKTVMDHGQWIVATPVVLYSGWPFLYGAWRDISSRQVTMDLPVGIAIFTAYSFSAANVIRGEGVLWFDSATMFVTLLLIARQLESIGRGRATEHLHKLFSQQKNTARRVADNGESAELATSLIAIGDIVEVHPSEAIPVDGVALAGGLVSEAVLTGEPIPKNKQAGDQLYAGSILLGAEPMRLRTTASGKNTALGRITQLMHQALTSRPQLQQLADKVASYFVLTVLSLAVIGGSAWAYFSPEKGLTVALTVLVASCPCALSLATPAALAASISRMARRGMLVLKLDGLMQANKVNHVVFDKTGTLTSDELVIDQVWCSDGFNQDQVLSIAAGLEAISTHPIAKAFAAIKPATIEQGSIQPTSVSGRHQNAHYLLQASQPDELNTHQVTTTDGTIYLTLWKADSAIAIISLLAPLRSDAKAAISQLQNQNIEVSIFSGDQAGNVAAVAQQLGINNHVGHLTPAKKLQLIGDLQARGQVVAAVGDGVNDAPLLAAADIGIAMGSGTAQAQSGASVILSNNNLMAINDVLDESKTLHKRIRQNISWAIAYNLTVFPLALSGSLAPWLAAIGMASSSILVVSNAMRGSKSGSPAAQNQQLEASISDQNTGAATCRL